MDDIYLLRPRLCLLLPFFSFLFFVCRRCVNGVQRCFLNSYGATTGKARQHRHQFFVHLKRKNSRSTAAFGRGVCAGGCDGGLLHSSTESLSPVLAVGHEEQHLADATETIFQGGEGQERQLGSTF